MNHRLAIPLAVLVAVALLAGACGAATPEVQRVEVTRVVEVEKEVEKVVEKVVEKEVEKIVEVAPEEVDHGSIVWLSTQLRPIQEAERLRGVILDGFPGRVDFIPEDGGPFADRVTAEVQAGKGTVDVLGGLHGDFTPMAAAGQLQDLSALYERLKDRGFPESFVEVARLGTDQLYYIPWMQATYILAANKVALEHLPQGADPNALTYADLAAWARNIQEATGENKFGLPAGEKGLLHRFFQGYLIPAFTGGAVTTYRSPEASEAWSYLLELWEQAHPQSLTYEFMQEPLLSEEVWLAWDHTARLKDAFEARPDDFVALPSPAGPEGRAFMPVIAGLAIPVTAPNQAGAEALIDWLTQPEVQITTLREVGFFPVIDVDFPGFVSPGVKLEGEAVGKQAASADALPSLLPVGLGAKGGEFNKIYLDTFRRIVIQGEPVATVLAEQGELLNALMQETGAACWAPDPPSGDNPCQVK